MLKRQFVLMLLLSQKCILTKGTYCFDVPLNAVCYPFLPLYYPLSVSLTVFYFFLLYQKEKKRCFVIKEKSGKSRVNG